MRECVGGGSEREPLDPCATTATNPTNNVKAYVITTVLRTGSGGARDWRLNRR